MKNPLSFITTRFKGAGSMFRSSSFSQENVLFFGTLFTAALLVGVLAWDGYLFTLSSRQHKTSEAPGLKTRELSPSEIDNALRILDERQQRFNVALGKPPDIIPPAASSTPPASSTPIQ